MARSAARRAGRRLRLATFWRADGDLDEAARHVDHPDVAMICNNLGTLLLQQRRDAEADGQFRRALSIAERAYPAGHPMTAGILHNLDRPRVAGS